MQIVSSFLCFLSLALLGAHYVTPVADATCQIRLKFTGSLMEPDWDDGILLGDHLCTGSCPSGSACGMSTTPVSATQTDY